MITVNKLVMLLIGVLMLAGTGLLVVSSNISAQTEGGGLGDATDADMEQAAIDFTNLRFNELSGSPKARLVRSVTVDDLPSLGLPRINFAAQDPPLKLVILEGDFDVSDMRGGPVHKQVKYLAYVFDLRAGVPALIATSVNGGRFRDALSDPTLPDDVPLVRTPEEAERAASMPEAVPMPELKPTDDEPPYGYLAPPVAPPDHFPFITNHRESPLD